MVFDKQWFDHHQYKLIWLLNAPIIKHWFRWVLCIDNKEVINRIEPNAYWFGGKLVGDKIEIVVDFRTHDKYGKRLYFAFKPIWWVMHIWDLVVDDLAPRLSFGFDTLTAYPDPGDPGTTTVDGNIEFTSATSWSGARDATDGSSANSVLQNTFHLRATRNGALDWTVRRSFYLFDTSTLTASATISAAVFSLCGQGSAPSNTDSTSINIVSSTPASNTTLTTTDFDQVGSTAFATINSASWTATDGVYNDFTLDANGRANISKTAVSKFAARLGRDLSNLTPTGANDLASYFSDFAGTTNDPKLVVTYSLAAVGGATPVPTLLMMGVG